MTLQKPEKSNYQMPRFWWLIALLKTLRKIVTAILAFGMLMVAESSGLVVMWSHTPTDGYISQIILDSYSIPSWSFHVTIKWNSCCLVDSHHHDIRPRSVAWEVTYPTRYFTRYPTRYPTRYSTRYFTRHSTRYSTRHSTRWSPVVATKPADTDTDTDTDPDQSEPIIKTFSSLLLYSSFNNGHEQSHCSTSDWTAATTSRWTVVSTTTTLGASAAAARWAAKSMKPDTRTTTQDPLLADISDWFILSESKQILLYSQDKKSQILSARPWSIQWPTL